MITNWNPILNDVAYVEADFNNQNYTQAGLDTADILVLSLGTVNHHNLETEVDWDSFKDTMTLY